MHLLMTYVNGLRPREKTHCLRWVNANPPALLAGHWRVSAASLPAFLAAFLTSVIHPFLPSCLPSFRPSFRHSFLHSFLQSFLRSFRRSPCIADLPSFIPSFMFFHSSYIHVFPHYVNYSGHGRGIDLEYRDWLNFLGGESIYNIIIV